MNVDLEAFDPRASGRDGAELLDAVHGILTGYVAFPSEEATAAVTLWALHTHAIDAWDTTPRLALLSPEPQSGKTRTLEVLELLARQPRHVANMSAALLARTVDADAPTILLDEADTIFGSRAVEHEDLRGLINAGHRRGVSYDRMVGEGAGMVAKSFSVFAPVALAGIGDLPETVMQRAVVVRMRRRAPGEDVLPFRFRAAREECEPLRDALTAWAGARVDQLAVARPVMPEGITDRSADVWEPLLAIAGRSRRGLAEACPRGVRGAGHRRPQHRQRLVGRAAARRHAGRLRRSRPAAHADDPRPAARPDGGPVGRPARGTARRPGAGPPAARLRRPPHKGQGGGCRGAGLPPRGPLGRLDPLPATPSEESGTCGTAGTAQVRAGARGSGCGRGSGTAAGSGTR